MEKYINLETLIKNEIFESLQEYVICPICNQLILEPIKCSKCENNFCKKCLNKNNKCPEGCEKTELKITKQNFIKKLKFKCIKGCGAEIRFDDITKHYNSDCLKDNNNNNKIKFLSKEQMSNIKKDDISYIKSKFYKIIFFIFYLYSNHPRGPKCRKNIFN